VEIYHHDQIFNRTIRHLQSTPNVCEEDKTNILKLVEHLLAKGVSKPRAVKYINHLIILTRMAGKPLAQHMRRDVERLVSRINTADYTESTKYDYKIILTKFLKLPRNMMSL